MYHDFPVKILISPSLRVMRIYLMSYAQSIISQLMGKLNFWTRLFTTFVWQVSMKLPWNGNSNRPYLNCLPLVKSISLTDFFTRLYNGLGVSILLSSYEQAIFHFPALLSNRDDLNFMKSRLDGKSFFWRNYWTTTEYKVEILLYNQCLFFRLFITNHSLGLTAS